MEARQITLDMRPLKEALKHKAIDQYIMNLLKKFPPCDLDQVEDWQGSGWDDELFDSLPACQPDPFIVSEALQEWREDIDYDIPDEVDIFEGARYLPRGLTTARTVVSLTYLLFLIPAAFIAIGALIGASSKQGFLQWIGVTTIIGGIIPLGMAIFAKKIVPLSMHWIPYDYSQEVSIQFQDMVLDKVGGLMSVAFDQLFSPVIAVAGTVCIVGIILYALSFAVSQDSAEPVRETAAAEPQEESKTTEEAGQPATEKKEE